MHKIRNYFFLTLIIAPISASALSLPYILAPHKWDPEVRSDVGTALVFAEYFGSKQKMLSQSQATLISLAGAYIFFAEITRLDTNRIKTISTRGSTARRLDFAYSSLGLIRAMHQLYSAVR